MDIATLSGFIDACTQLIIGEIVYLYISII
jgi:hypothetical protein